MAEHEYEYQSHPHVAARELSGPPVSAHHKRTPRRSFWQKINDRIGLGITRRVGTMWAAYIFAILSLVSLPAAIASGNLIIIIGWIAQTFLQLVLLPIIIVGQNIQAQSADRRAIATYEDAGAILAEAIEIQAHLAAQDKQLSELVKRMEKLEKTKP